MNHSPCLPLFVDMRTSPPSYPHSHIFPLSLTNKQPEQNKHFAPCLIHGIIQFFFTSLGANKRARKLAQLPASFHLTVFIHTVHTSAPGAGFSGIFSRVFLFFAYNEVWTILPRHSGHGYCNADRRHGNGQWVQDQRKQTPLLIIPTRTRIYKRNERENEKMNLTSMIPPQMLWNWDVVDVCFMSTAWHIHSRAMFGGSCIGVVLLAILLEFLRRAGKEYDRFIVAQQNRMRTSSPLSSSSPTMIPTSTSSSEGNGTNKTPGARTSAGVGGPPPTSMFRPTIVQQAIRALLHTCQFAVAFGVMLLAMYYNGYFIICIFIGVYVGYFIFGWESFNVGNRGDDRTQENVTVCCG